MVDRWVISDTHFGHKNILTFNHDGKPVREFSSVEEMDEIIVQNWNKVVKQDDIVYHLGDVVIGSGDNINHLSIIDRCNGLKVLVKGNHDLLDDSVYLRHFANVFAMIIPKNKKMSRMIMSHFPIHESCVDRFKINLHGHIHSASLNDNRYINCCVDYPGNDYSPLNLEAIRDKVV